MQHLLRRIGFIKGPIFTSVAGFKGTPCTIFARCKIPYFQYLREKISPKAAKNSALLGGNGEGGSQDGNEPCTSRKPPRTLGATAAAVVLLSTTLLVSGAGGYIYWSEARRRNKIYATLNPDGTRYSADQAEKGVMVHVESEKAVKEFINSSLENDRYDLITGSSGSGRSTLMQKIAREIPGMVYVPIGKDGNLHASLTHSFIGALSWQEPQDSWLRKRWRDFADPPKKLDISHTAPVKDDNAQFFRVLRDFEIAAARFRAEKARPAILVLDDVDIAAEKDPELLAALRAMAHEAGNHGLFKVIFICSPGVAGSLAMENK